MNSQEILEGLEIKDITQLKNVAEYIDCVFQVVDFTSYSLSKSRFIDCIFVECNLSNAQVVNTTLRGCEFQGCKMLGVNFSNTFAMSLLKFSNSILDYSIFQAINGEGFEFISCSLKEVDFSESKFKNSLFKECDLLGSNFSSTDLSKVDLRRSINYNINPRFTKVQKARFSSPEVLTLLSGLDIIIE